MAEPSGSQVYCLRCGEQAKMGEVVEHIKGNEGPQIEMFQCPNERCGARVAVIHEPVHGSTPEQTSWVEEQVRRRGAFFPADFGAKGGRFGR
jgi:hypothetical protein